MDEFAFMEFICDMGKRNCDAIETTIQRRNELFAEIGKWPTLRNRRMLREVTEQQKIASALLGQNRFLLEIMTTLRNGTAREPS